MNILILLILFSGMGLPLSLKFNSNHNWQKVFGEGFFAGIMLVMVLYECLQFAGINAANTVLFYSAIIIAIAIWIGVIFHYREYLKKGGLKNLTKDTNIIFLVFLIYVLIHISILAFQNQLFPLTPWDSWTGWVAKAKIWYYYGIAEPLVSNEEWLNLDSGLSSMIAHYPDGLSLLYVFISGGFGWNETAINSVYIAMFVAFLFAYYGNIKLLTQDRHFSMLSVFIFVTLPLAGVHIALAGYADMWIAVYSALIFLNLQLLIRRFDYSRLIILIIFGVALLVLKQEGLIWIFCFGLAYLIARLSFQKVKWMILVVSVIICLWILTGGISIGSFIFTPSRISIPGIMDYSFTFVNTTNEWIEGFFLSRNWNILWYSLLVVLILLFSIRDKSECILSTAFLSLAMMFLFVLFYFSYANKFASNFTSINRLVLQIVPIYIYFSLRVFKSYYQQNSRSK